MEPMSKGTRYSPELRERAVRMVFDHAHDHPSQWATIRSVAEKLGRTVCGGGYAKPNGIAAHVPV
jgi:transposase-like protein